MSKFPIIVIEGPDGCGKSTLADALCDYLGGHYVHLTYRFRDKMHCYHGAALKQALIRAELQPVIIDRWWPSELVYADAYRGGSRWPLMYRHLHRVALRHGISYVFCLPEDRARYLEHYEHLKTTREEMYDEGMGRVYDGFARRLDDMCREGVPALYRYDLFEQGAHLDDVVQAIVQTSEDERAMLPDYAKDVGHVNLSGSPHRAKFVVVGDLQDQVGSRWQAQGPFVNYDANDGLRWSRALERARVPEPDLCYVDLPEGGGVIHETVVRECARTMQVVALGHRALATLKQLDIPVYAEVVHPRDWGVSRRDDYLKIFGVFRDV